MTNNVSDDGTKTSCSYLADMKSADYGVHLYSLLVDADLAQVRVMLYFFFISRRPPIVEARDIVTHSSVRPYVQDGAKNGATLSHCNYSENSITELRGNW